MAKEKEKKAKYIIALFPPEDEGKVERYQFIRNTSLKVTNNIDDAYQFTYLKNALYSLECAKAASQFKGLNAVLMKVVQKIRILDVIKS